RLLSTGCGLRAEPYVLEPGWVIKTNWLAVAGLTAIMLELVPVTPEALKAREILVATLWARSVKLTRPLRAVRLVVACTTPLPALRAALTPLEDSVVLTLPNLARSWRTGCSAKRPPAAAAAEGWV